MCGIVGYVGSRNAVPILLDCLSRLEYRGYDSAGIATLDAGCLELRKACGKNQVLHELLAAFPMAGNVGVAHTRWATHGIPSTENAHPHADCDMALAVVHNGIIENHVALRCALQQDGHEFRSGTDSETVAHLFEDAFGDCRGCDDILLAAAARVIPRLEGAYAIALLSDQAPEQLFVARNSGAPMVIGHADDGVLVSSDTSAILSYTRDIHVLGVGEMAVISANRVRVVKFDGTPVDATSTRISWRAGAADKGSYPHFMLKEIHEQPEALEAAIRSQDIKESGDIRFPQAAMLTSKDMESLQRVTIVACGTSWHAAMVGKYLLESIAGVAVDVDIASEYRYRPGIDRQDLLIAISQSGETADTLGAIEAARQRSCHILSICNVEGSSMCRESDGVVYTHAGPEIGVASTKAFTTQLAALYMLAVSLASRRGAIARRDARELVNHLMTLPEIMATTLGQCTEFAEDAAGRFEAATSSLFLGRGIQFPIALEGALKLKEISYIHAEGYAAGEMKHGPIALIDRHTPVVAIATASALHEKTLANVEEVRAREGIVTVLATEGDASVARLSDHVAYLPRMSEWLQPVLNAVPLQLLAYYTAVRRGCDVDKPRNLAKSVTVE